MTSPQSIATARRVLTDIIAEREELSPRDEPPPPDGPEAYGLPADAERVDELMNGATTAAAVATTPTNQGQGKPPIAAKFRPVWLADIQVDDDPACLIEGIFPAGPSFGVTFGPPKSLKSFFLMYVCFHISANFPRDSAR